MVEIFNTRRSAHTFSHTHTGHTYSRTGAHRCSNRHTGSCCFRAVRTPFVGTSSASVRIFQSNHWLPNEKANRTGNWKSEIPFADCARIPLNAINHFYFIKRKVTARVSSGSFAADQFRFPCNCLWIARAHTHTHTRKPTYYTAIHGL